MTEAVRIAPAILLLAVFCPPPSDAQSLADLARQEAARRNNVRASSRTLTNADLAPDPNRGRSASESAALETAPANQSPAVMAKPVPPPKLALDEAYWRLRAAELRRRVAVAEQEVRSLTGVTRDDPREQARTQALLKKRQDRLTRAEDAFQLFLMQVDVANVPDEWIQ